MAFYDEIGKKLSRTKDEAVQKTKNYTEITRLNSSISELEKEISSGYMEIGRIYYAKYAKIPESAEAELSGSLQKISDYMGKVEEYRKEILQLKGLRRCDSCGKEIGADAIFCNYCGAKQMPKINVEKAKNVCAKCGTPYEEGYLFCRHCGANLREMQQKVQKKYCKNCGAEIGEGMRFCMKCGWKVENEQGGTPNAAGTECVTGSVLEADHSAETTGVAGTVHTEATGSVLETACAAGTTGVAGAVPTEATRSVLEAARTAGIVNEAGTARAESVEPAVKTPFEMETENSARQPIALKTEISEKQ